MKLRTAAVITFAILLALALAQLAGVADELVSLAEQRAGFPGADAGAADLDHVGGIATPVMVP